jgi:transposase
LRDHFEHAAHLERAALDFSSAEADGVARPSLDRAQDVRQDELISLPTNAVAEGPDDALRGDIFPASRELKLLVEARDDLAAEATRIRNRLHADLVVIAPGYSAVASNLVAEKYRRAIGRLLRRMPGVQAELARGRLSRLAQLATEIRALDRRIEGLVADHPLRQLWGAGPLVTAKLLGEIGDIRRFRSADAFAMLAGVAPIPASSGQTSRMRLNRGGNRQINRALHGIVLAQVRTYQPAKDFVARKKAEGKSWREALRALKRHLARIVFRLLSQPQSGVVLGGLTR